MDILLQGFQVAVLSVAASRLYAGMFLLLGLSYGVHFGPASLLSLTSDLY